MVFVFFLAFFLDFFEICFIVVPMLLPAAHALDINMIWFGLLLCVNIQTSFMHPPFGFALFYLRGIAPKEVKSRDIYWGSIPWIGLQLVHRRACWSSGRSRSPTGSASTRDARRQRRRAGARRDRRCPDAGGDLGAPDLGIAAARPQRQPAKP